MKRFPEIARRAVSLALAASMSLSVLAPCASAAAAARDLENSVDELGNVDLSDEVFEVPDDTAAAVGTPEEPETPAEEDAGVADDLTEEQLAEQAVVDAAGHEEHTPDTDAEPVYEEPSTCVEAGYAIYPCSFTLEQEDGTVAHCYHQVVVTLPLADHQWGDWQDAADADSQKYRVCEVCGAVEYEDGTVVTPGGIPIVDPDHPEWLPGDGSEIAMYSAISDVTDAVKKITKAIEDFQAAYKAFKNGDPEKMKTSELETAISAYESAEKALKDVSGVLSKWKDNKWVKDLVASLQGKIDDLNGQLNEVRPQYEKAKDELKKRQDAEALAKAAREDVEAAEAAYAKIAANENVTLDDISPIERQIKVAKDKVSGVQDAELKGDLESRLNTLEQNIAALKGKIAYQEAEPAVAEAEKVCAEVKAKADSGEEFTRSDITEITKKVATANLKVDLLPDGADKDSLQARLDKVNETVKALGQELTDRTAVAAAKALVEKAESAADGVTGTPSEGDIANALLAYQAAKTAVDKLDQNREDVKALQARLEVVNQKISKLEGQYAEAAIKDILEKLKNGELSKDELVKLRDMLQALDKFIPASGDLRDLYDQTMGVLDAAISAIDLAQKIKALIDQLQEEIKNGNISQDTVKQLQDIIKQAGDLVEQVKNNELLQGMLKDLAQKIGDAAADAIKQAEAALKEAAAKAAVDLVKQAIADGNLEKIDQAFKAANEAIDALEPYMPEVAQQFREELEKLREQVYDKVLQGAQDILNDPKYKSEEERLEALKKYAESLDEILKDYDGPDVDKITAAVKADVANKALDALKEAIKNGDLSKIDAAFDEAKKAIDALRPYAPGVADKLTEALEEIKTTYVNGLKDELEKALENGTWQEKLDNLKKVADKYRDLINKIDVSGALKELWDTILNEELTKLITDMANEINKIVNDKDMSALEKIAALNKLSDDLHKKMEDIVGKDLADKLLKPFDDMIEKAKETVAKAAATVGDSLIKEALKAIRQAVDSAESKEDAINKMESIYDQAHELLTKAGMSDADATAKLEPVRSAIDSIKKLLDESFVSMDTIKAAVDVLVDAMLASDTIEGGLHDLVRAVLDGKDLDPAVTRAILVIARDVLKKADWSKLTPSLLDDVMDLVIDKVKEKISKKYISPIAKVANELIDELEPTMNDLVHKEVGQDTIDKVRDVFLKALDNGIDGIDAGKSREDLLDTARDDLLGLSPVVSAELKRIGAKAAESVNKEMHDKVEAALPGVILPDLIGDLIGNLAEDIVNDEIGKEDPKITAEIDKYVRYLTCPGHKHATRISQAQGCTTDEITEDYCTRCGWVFSSTKTADALGHDPMFVPGVEPTEDMDGLTDGIQCARCGAWLEPQEVLPALNPAYDKWFVKADITAETVKATGYQSRQKLDEAIDSALKKAGFEPANSERFLAQVRTNLEIDEGYILPNDRYPEEGVTGMVKFPAKALGKDGTYYAVQVVTADNHGYNAGDIVVTPLTVTKEGISLKTGVQAVVAIAWKPNN